MEKGLSINLPQKNKKLSEKNWRYESTKGMVKFRSMTAIYQKHKDQTSSVGEKLILFLTNCGLELERIVANSDLYKKDTNNSILLNVFLTKYDNKRKTSNHIHTDTIFRYSTQTRSITKHTKFIDIQTVSCEV